MTTNNNEPSVLNSKLQNVLELHKKWFYFPLIGALVAIDVFILIIPSETIVTFTSAMKPKKFIFTAFFLTFSSLVGGFIFCKLIETYGLEFLQSHYPSLMGTDAWLKSKEFIRHYGFIGVSLMILGPLPQPGTLAVGVLLGMGIPQILLAVLVGRLPKYLFFAWMGAKAPHVYQRFFKTKT